MLSGETPRTLRIGLIVSALALRIRPTFVAIRLDSGIEGVVNVNYLADKPVSDIRGIIKPGQTLSGVVIDVQHHAEQDLFFVELSSRPADVAAGDSAFRRVRQDEAWNRAKYERDLEVQQGKRGLKWTRRGE
jgi:transcription elongation factor SPT6